MNRSQKLKAVRTVIDIVMIFTAIIGILACIFLTYCIYIEFTKPEDDYILHATDNNVILTRSFEPIDERYQEIIDQYKTNVSSYLDANIYASGDLDPDRVDLLRRTFKSQDIIVLKAFMDAKYKIYFCNESDFFVLATGDNVNNNTIGQIDYLKKEIYVRAGSTISEYDCVRTVRHETGHFLGWWCDRCDDSGQWEAITEKEFKSSGFDRYYSNPREYFAECYAQYLGNELSRRKTPISRIYIENTIDFMRRSVL